MDKLQALKILKKYYLKMLEDVDAQEPPPTVSYWAKSDKFWREQLGWHETSNNYMRELDKNFSYAVCGREYFVFEKDPQLRGPLRQEIRSACNLVDATIKGIENNQ